MSGWDADRRAITANYQLSGAEAALYAAVTDYVKEEMNRADKLDGQRKGTVGFALTALQRRLASSPEAIYQSLRRRRERLESRLRELEVLCSPAPQGLGIDEDHLEDYLGNNIARLCGIEPTPPPKDLVEAELRLTTTNL